ncbi:MAG: transporter substrate-binding protein [Burkholderiaceae bacterium]|jgi:branched-chain amino acid transport system substrate-binding protein
MKRNGGNGGVPHAVGQAEAEQGSGGRRSFLKSSALIAGGAAIGYPLAGLGQGKGSGKPIEVASMFDLTGNLNIYGVQAMNVSRYAIESINKNGGVLGRPLKLHTYDTQSKIELYSRYSQEIGANDAIAAVVGCFTGASREASRPILSRYRKILFFPTIDEGGECDKFTFMQGTDCLQQQTPLIDWAAKNVGKTFYVAAADYVYGHVATAWTKSLVQKAGGKIAGIEFIPLDVSDFGSTIRKIQTAGPAVVMSHLVGNNHIAFYRQFAAAGLNESIQIISPTFGLGNEQEVLSPKESKGIVVAYSYFETVGTPENKAFVSGFRQAVPNAGPIPDAPVQVWNGWHQWKAAVEKAGTTDIDKVVAALESGVPYVGPSGKVFTDGPSHRNVQDVHLARIDDQRQYQIFHSYQQVNPSREVVGAGSCDLTGKDKKSHRMIHPKI